MPPAKFYAIARGRQTGVFGTWGEAQPLVSGFAGARYKSFPSFAEAARFVEEETSTTAYAAPPPPTRSAINYAAPSGPSYGQSASHSCSHAFAGSPPMGSRGGTSYGHSGVYASNPNVSVGNPNGGKFYAVARGRATGVFSTWAEAEPLVAGWVGARYKSFFSRAEAEEFVRAEGMAALLARAAAEVASSVPPRSRPPPSVLPSLQYANFEDAFPEMCNSYTNANSSTSGRNVGRPPTPQVASVSASDLLPAAASRCGLGAPLIAYTDGACPNNGNAAAAPRAGYGVHYPKDENARGGARFGLPADISRAVPRAMKQTNNVGELMGVNAAVRQIVERDRSSNSTGEDDAELNARRLQPLVVHTDSKYCIDGATQWLSGWAARGWRQKGQGSTRAFAPDAPDEEGYVKNVGLWQELDALLQERREQMASALIATGAVGGASGDEGRRVGAKSQRFDGDAADEAARVAKECATVFKHVRGHNGIAGNEAADRLAVMGAVGMGSS